MLWKRSQHPKLYKIGKTVGEKNLSNATLTLVCMKMCAIRIFDMMLYARLNKVHCSKTTDALRTEATWNWNSYGSSYTHLALNEKLKAKRRPEQKCSGKNNKIVPTNELVFWRNGERTTDTEKLWKYQPTTNNNERIAVSGWNEKHQILLKH